MFKLFRVTVFDYVKSKNHQMAAAQDSEYEYEYEDEDEGAQNAEPAKSVRHKN